MKKMLMTVAVAAVSLSAVATAADNFSGGYAGVQAGAAFRTQYKKKPATVTLGGTAVVANLLGGYGSVFSENLYAGAEGQIGTGFGENKKKYADGTVKYKNNSFFTLGGRLGYLPSQEVMLFASLAVGVENTKVKAPPAEQSTFKESHTGFIMLPGVGAEVKVAQNVNLRADLSYKFAWHKNGVKTQQPIAKLGVVYKF